jgi:ketosteroid isomerase-like protein
MTNSCLAGARMVISMRELTVILSITCMAIGLCGGSISVAAETEEQSIHETYKAWVHVTNAKDIEKWPSFLAANPYFSPADSPPLTGTDEVIDYYERSFADPKFSLDCEQEYVDVSESGEMAWSRGRCNATFTGPDGGVASGTSRWFKVWIKQSDGSWRCRVNTWRNVDEL